MVAASEVDDRAGEGAGDAVDGLDPGDHQLAEVVDVAGLGPHDHVVGPGDVLGLLDALDLGDFLGDLGRLANLGLNQDVRRHHEHRPPCLTAATDWATTRGGPADAPRPPRCRGPEGHGALRVNLRMESWWKRCAHGTRGHQACQGSIWPIQAATGGRPGTAEPDSRRPWRGTRGPLCSNGDFPRGMERVSRSIGGSSTESRPASGWPRRWSTASAAPRSSPPRSRAGSTPRWTWWSPARSALQATRSWPSATAPRASRPSTTSRSAGSASTPAQSATRWSARPRRSPD